MNHSIIKFPHLYLNFSYPNTQHVSSRLEFSHRGWLLHQFGRYEIFIEPSHSSRNSNRLKCQNEINMAEKVSPAPSNPRVERSMTGADRESRPIHTSSYLKHRSHLRFPCTRMDCRASFKTRSALENHIHSIHFSTSRQEPQLWKPPRPLYWKHRRRPYLLWLPTYVQFLRRLHAPFWASSLKLQAS